MTGTATSGVQMARAVANIVVSSRASMIGLASVAAFEFIGYFERSVSTVAVGVHNLMRAV